MARKSKSLANAFEQFQEPEKENVSEKENTSETKEDVNKKRQMEQESSNVSYLDNKQDIKEDVTSNSNTDSISKDVIQEGNTEPEPKTVTEKPNLEFSTKTIKDVTKSIMDMYDEKSKKKTVEETHTRSTFLFRNDLQERLDKLAEGKRGFKTMFLNRAIEALLDEMEDGRK